MVLFVVGIGTGALMAACKMKSALRKCEGLLQRSVNATLISAELTRVSLRALDDDDKQQIRAQLQDISLHYEKALATGDFALRRLRDGIVALEEIR